MTKFGTPIGAGPKSATVRLGLRFVGAPLGWRSGGGDDLARVRSRRGPRDRRRPRPPSAMAALPGLGGRAGAPAAAARRTGGRRGSRSAPSTASSGAGPAPEWWARAPGSGRRGASGGAGSSSPPGRSTPAAAGEVDVVRLRRPSRPGRLTLPPPGRSTPPPPFSSGRSTPTPPGRFTSLPSPPEDLGADGRRALRSRSQSRSRPKRTALPATSCRPIHPSVITRRLLALRAPQSVPAMNRRETETGAPVQWASDAPRSSRRRRGSGCPSSLAASTLAKYLPGARSLRTRQRPCESDCGDLDLLETKSSYDNRVTLRSARNRRASRSPSPTRPRS